MDDTLQQHATDVAVIFDNVANYADLISAFRPGVEVYVLDANRDGLEQIASILDGRTNISALHVVGHGSRGTINLGSVTLDAGTIGAYSDVLGRIGSALTNDGDILLYGCNVASGSIGLDFIDTLARYTGADIAASTDLTGNADLGGNWSLEVAKGTIDTQVPMMPASVATYSGLLVIGDENFDGLGQMMASGVPLEAGNWTFTADMPPDILVDMFVANSSESPFPSSEFPFPFWLNSDGGPGDRAVLLNPYIDPGVRVYKMKSTDGSNFKLESFKIGQNILADPNLSIAAYSNGSQVVGPEAINLRASGSSGNITYTFIAEDSQKGRYGTLTFNGAYSDIDEIHFTFLHDADLHIDDIDVSPAVSDTTAPVFASATVNGSTLVMSYTDANNLDGTKIPAVNCFAVTADGTSVTVSSVSVDDVAKTVTLTLASAVGYGQTVTIAYTDPTAGNDANAIQDAAGNDAATLSATNVTNNTPDSTPPTIVGVTSTSANGAYKAGAVIAVTVEFSEAVTVTGTPQLTLETGTTDRVVNYASGTGTSKLIFNYTVQPGDTSADLDYVSTSALALNGGTIKDVAGNNATLTLPAPGEANSLGANKAIAIDTTAPTTTVASAALSADTGTSGSDFITKTAAQTITGTLSANLASGEIVYVSLDNGSTWNAATATVGQPTWSLFGSTLSGSNTLKVKVSDAAGNDGSVYSRAYTLDTIAPTVAISSNVSMLRIGQTATITFTFSEDPGSTFSWDGTSGDVVVTGGTLGAISGTGTTRTATFTPTANTNNGTASITVASGAYTDVAGNNGGAGATPSITFDTQAPTVTITSDKAVLGAGGTATITFSFSEDPGASFGWDGTSGDVVVSGGTLGAISGTGTTRTATFTPGSGSTASITVTAGSYTDAAGNVGAGATSPTIVLDTIPPVAPSTPVLAAGSDTGTSASDNLTKVAAPTLRGTAEAGATVKLYDSNGVTEIGSGTADGSGNWSITTSINLSSGLHNITAKAIDAAGNVGSASTPLAVTIDTVAPTLTISSDVPKLKIGEAATITFTFSEDPGDTFAYDDITVSGGTLGPLSGSGTTRIATFTPTPNTNGGTASITVDPGKYTDAAGNNGGAGSTPSLIFDTALPTIAISSSKSTLKAGETATITFTFSEDPGSSFTWDGTSGSVAVTGGNLGAISGTGTTRTAIFTPDPDTNDGTASITVASGAYTDAAGNAGGAGAVPSLTFDTLVPGAPSAPDLAAASDSGSSNTDNLTSNTTPTFSGTAEANATVKLYDGATEIGSGTADGTGNWSITASTLSDGTHSVTATATDAAGNTSAASAALSITVDTTPPATTFSGMAFSADTGSSGSDFITNTAAQTIIAALSTGLAVGDILYGSLDGGGSWTDLTAMVSGTTLIWTGVTLAAGTSSLKLKVTDAAGNDGTMATQAYTLDTTAPTVVIASAAFSADTGNSSSDFVTNAVAQTISGTLSANLTAGETVYVSLDNGANWNAATATVGQNTWSLAGQTLTGSNTLKVKVTDAAGNDGAVATQAYTLDTTPPVIQTATANGNTLTLTYSDGSALDAANTASTSAFKVLVNGAEIAVNTVTVDANAKTVKLALASAVQYGQTVKLDYADPTVGDDVNSIQDAAGNDAVSLTGHAVTNDTPAPPPAGPSVPPPTTSTVDGVPVQTGQVTNSDGSTSQQIIIPVVTPDRPEEIGNNTVADIPLVRTSTGNSLLTAQVPAGYGLQVTGTAAPKAADSSLTDLIREIQAHTEAGSTDQNQLTGGGSGFLQNLSADAPLLVQTVVPTVAPNAAAPSEPLVITGTPAGAGNPATALVIDARGLPNGTAIQLQNVEFAAIIGAVRVTGGAGSQTVWGDSSSQYIMLGADDDILHGGAGDDTVGSGGGNDQIFGDEGDDLVFGGEGDDFIDGGTGTDTVLLVGSGRGDYSMRVENGMLKMTHRNGGADGTDIVANVELLQFASAQADTSAYGTVSRLYEALLGRSPDPVGMSGWVSAHQNGLSWQEIAQRMLASQEAQQRHGDSSDTDYVSALYRSVLQREADATGLASAVKALGDGALDRAGLALLIVDSQEKLSMARPEMLDFNSSDIATLVRLYDSLFDRKADATGLNHWIALSESGTTLADIADGFLQSAEALARYDGMSNAEFVNTLYQSALHRQALAGEAAGWIAQLDSGAVDRGDVLLGFAESAEKAELIGVISTSIETL